MFLLLFFIAFILFVCCLHFCMFNICDQIMRSCVFVILYLLVVLSCQILYPRDKMFLCCGEIGACGWSRVRTHSEWTETKVAEEGEKRAEAEAERSTHECPDTSWTVAVILCVLEISMCQIKVFLGGGHHSFGAYPLKSLYIFGREVCDSAAVAIEIINALTSSYNKVPTWWSNNTYKWWYAIRCIFRCNSVWVDRANQLSLVMDLI